MFSVKFSLDLWVVLGYFSTCLTPSNTMLLNAMDAAATLKYKVELCLSVYQVHHNLEISVTVEPMQLGSTLQGKLANGPAVVFFLKFGCILG